MTSSLNDVKFICFMVMFKMLMELCLSVLAGVVDSSESTRAIYCEARGEREARQSPEGETEGREERRKKG